MEQDMETGIKKNRDGTRHGDREKKRTGMEQDMATGIKKRTGMEQDMDNRILIERSFLCRYSPRSQFSKTWSL